MKKSLKNDIITHLTSKGTYDPNVDDFVIDLLIDNLTLSDELRDDIRKNGIIVTIPNGNGIATTKENPAYGTYDKCINNVFQCAIKLGINRKDRITLKIMEEKKFDDFDDDFSK